jgi:Tol biopolymer transport system component
MPLTSGARLGPYEIVAPLGAGGMGEVYRARDTRLDRTVAIKILPEVLAGDPQFRERFEREAKSVSTFNHPNICAIYDVGRDRDIDFLVLEYLDGETLATRLEKGALALSDALRTAIDIASALDTAHRHGIVHRDLKPGNVMLTKGGAKLLDFGLAKMAPFGVLSQVGSTTPPTATTPLTAQGSLLGTYQYMAPEQIEGQDADARTDIFAFGTVLYEMVTGRKAFQGKSQASLLGAILKDEPPPVSQVQPVSPPALDYLVRTCLAKDPENRFQTPHDLLLSLRWIAEGGSGVRPGSGVPRRTWRDRTLWIAGAIVAVVLGGVGGWLVKPAPHFSRVVSRLVYPLPAGQRFTRTGRRVVAISPDGTKLAYVANSQIYVRRLNELEAQPIRGSAEDPFDPVFSPDGESIAYFVPATVSRGAPLGIPLPRDPGSAPSTWGTLKKISVSGGRPVTLCSAAPPFGVSWQNGTITFGQTREANGRILAVPDTGGTPRTLVTVDARQGERVSHPQLLADGQRVLFTLGHATGWDDATIVVQALATGARQVLVRGGTAGRLVPSGHLIYSQGATVYALAIDLTSFEVRGNPVAMIEGIIGVTPTGEGQFAVSDNGTLVYAQGQAGSGGRLLDDNNATYGPGSPERQRTLVWVDRQGHEQPIAAPPRAYEYPRLSPDGSKIAVTARDEENDVWIWDVAHETMNRLTFGPALDRDVAWTPDSRHVIFGEYAARFASNLFRKATDGTGPTERLTDIKDGVVLPQSVSTDGKFLIFRQGFGGTNYDLMVLPLDPAIGDRHPRALIQTEFDEYGGEISPDGHWFAYQSNETGAFEVYVRPFPTREAVVWQISSGGGSAPAWSRDGRELFYIGRGSAHLVRVPVQAAVSSFGVGKAQTLFDLTPYVLFEVARSRTYDVSRDGRFLMIKNGTGTAQTPMLVIVSNWFDELKVRMSTK